MNSYKLLQKENQARHLRVMEYLEHLEQIGLTVDEEEQMLVKRRCLQISLELQDIKDCLVEGARNILTMQGIEDIDNHLYLDTDPSVRFFVLEWRTVFKICEKIYQDMTTFWTLLEETYTVTSNMLARTLSALDKLEYDVGNHDVAVHEKRFIVEQLEIEGGQEQGRRSKSCYQ